MKRLAFLLLTFGLSLGSHAQDRASFMRQLPRVPGNGCTANDDEKNVFDEKIQKVVADLGKLIESRNQEIEVWKKAHEKQIMAAAVDLPGYQGIDSDQLDKMTDKQKDEMADKLVQQKYGVSVEQLQKLSEMSDAEAAAEGQKLTAKMSASAQSDPKKTAADQAKDKSLAALTQEQMALVQKLGERVGDYQKQLSALEDDPKGREMLDKINAEQRKLESQNPRPPCEAAQKEERKVYAEKQQYCTSLAPREIEILNHYRAAIEAAFPDDDRADRLQGQILKTQFQVDPPQAQTGMTALGAIYHYALALEKAYQYRLVGAPLKLFSCDDHRLGMLSPRPLQVGDEAQLCAR